MEVIAQHRMEEVEATEELLLERRKDRRPDNGNGFHSDVDQELEKNRFSGKGVYLDDNGENNLKAEDLESLDISKLLNTAMINSAMTNREMIINTRRDGNDVVELPVSGFNASTNLQGTQKTWEVENISKTTTVGAKEEAVRIDIVHEESEDEEIELEFERIIEKVHTQTHTAHCPNCNREITKVVLRRRRRRIPNLNQPDSKPVAAADDEYQKPLDLFGCLSCFRIFFPSGSIPNLSSIFGTKEKNGSPGASPDQAESSVKPGTNVPGVTPDPDGIKSLEILKCIVYGGLLEALTSLSVVSSAAASDANTLSIICLGLANVIGGLFVIAQNLVDMKNEDSGGIPNQETQRYKELLGRRKHFPLHATLAVLSFLVFGLIPPIVYGFAFRASDNKDYKILAVAAASLASIIILATAKTYTKGPEKFSAYIKTILYYCTMAFAASGVSYAAGDLVKILMQKLDWFEPSNSGAGAASSFISNMNPATTAWTYY